MKYVRHRNLTRIHLKPRRPAPQLPLLDMAATERDITEDLIRDLLREQCPDLADRPSKLGDDLAVRLPWATQSPLPRGRPQAEIAGARWPTTPHRIGPPVSCWELSGSGHSEGRRHP